MMVVCQTPPLSLWRFSGSKGKWVNYVGRCTLVIIVVNDTSSFVRFACFSYCSLIASLSVWCKAALCAEVWQALTSLVGWYTIILSFRGLTSSPLSHYICMSLAKFITSMHWQPCAVASVAKALALGPDVVLPCIHHIWKMPHPLHDAKLRLQYSLVPRPPRPAFVACSTKSGARPGQIYHMMRAAADVTYCS